MFNRIDTAMLSTLIVLTLSSGWVQTHRQTPQPEILLRTVVEEIVEIVVPDFSTFVDVREKKTAFFEFMTPLIEQENERIMELRERVVVLTIKPKLSEAEQKWLLEMANRYRMKNVKDTDSVFFEELLSRVDVIPLSLALVQSANESAWGTSRFARQGNNFFGQWCFDPGCGIVPSSRPIGEIYEVRKFDGVADSVRSYMRNLNSHFKYDGMRELRQKRRQNDKAITGPILAQGLYAYSIRGIDYVEELVSMIASNDLLRYDLKKETYPEG